MRHFVCVSILLGVCNLVYAQDAQKAEVFGGFSYANYELLPPTASFSNSIESISGAPSARLGLYGWNGSIAVNMNRWFSFATDFSGYYSSSSTSTTTTQTFTCSTNTSCTDIVTVTASRPKIHNFFFGPQFSYPAGRVRPFAHFLMGGARSEVARSVSSICAPIGICTIGVGTSEGTSGLAFGMALGGGVDYSIKRNLAWRLGSDYLTGQGTAQNHVRVSTGLVWRLGQ